MVKNVQPFGPQCNWRDFRAIGSGGEEKNKVLTKYSEKKPSGLMGLLLIAISPCCPGGRILAFLSMIWNEKQLLF